MVDKFNFSFCTDDNPRLSMYLHFAVMYFGVEKLEFYK